MRTILVSFKLTVKAFMCSSCLQLIPYSLYSLSKKGAYLRGGGGGGGINRENTVYVDVMAFP